MDLTDKFLSLINPPRPSRKKKGKGLDLGCGENKHNDCVGVDFVDSPSVDIVHDLNESLPLESNEFNEVFILNVLEHLNDWISLLEEVHRVCREGAIIHIQVPYYKHKDAYTDPQHKHFFTEGTFEHLLNHEWHDFDGDFEIISQKKHRNIWLQVDSLIVELEVKK